MTNPAASPMTKPMARSSPMARRPRRLWPVALFGVSGLKPHGPRRSRGTLPESICCHPRGRSTLRRPGSGSNTNEHERSAGSGCVVRISLVRSPPLSSDSFVLTPTARSGSTRFNPSPPAAAAPRPRSLAAPGPRRESQRHFLPTEYCSNIVAFYIMPGHRRQSMPRIASASAVPRPTGRPVFARRSARARPLRARAPSTGARARVGSKRRRAGAARPRAVPEAKTFKLSLKAGSYTNKLRTHRHSSAKCLVHGAPAEYNCCAMCSCAARCPARCDTRPAGRAPSTVCARRVQPMEDG